MGARVVPTLQFATLNLLVPLQDYAGTELGLDAEAVGRALIDNYLSPAGIVADYQNDTIGFLSVSWLGSQRQFTWRKGLWVI